MNSAERLSLALELSTLPRHDERLARATEAVRSVPGLFLDERDGQLYPYLTFGGAEWMIRNLNFAGVEGAMAWEDTSYRHRSSAHRAQHGLLYTFEAAHQAVTPGWRLPTDQDWKDLLLPLGGFNQDGHPESPSVRSAYDQIMSRRADRFTAQLSGYFDPSDQWFHSRGSYGFYWANEVDLRQPERPRARSYQVNDIRGDIRRGTQDVQRGLSVRLVRNVPHS